MKLKTIAGCLLLLTSNIIFAETENAYQIKTKVYVDGKLLSSPRIVAKLKQPCAVTGTTDSGQTYKIEMSVDKA